MKKNLTIQEVMYYENERIQIKTAIENILSDNNGIKFK